MRARYGTMTSVVTSLLAVVFIALTIGSQPVNALTGKGYFSGNTGSWTSGYGGDVFPGRPGVTNVVPASAQNSKQGFINYIEGLLNTGTAREKTGAAFTINTMVLAGTGGNNPSKNKSPGGPMISTWKKRINDSNITMHKVYGDPNSYGGGGISFYDSGINDDFFTSYNSGNRPLIVFKLGSKVVYVVEVPCGNPVGGLGLPEPPINWEVTPKTEANNSSVQPGDPIPWDHSLKLSGPDDMDAPVDWEIRQFKKNSGDPNVVGSLVVGGTITDPKPKGVILSRSKSYTALDSDIGKRICQYIRVKPYAKVDSDLKNSFKSSDPVCVPVKKDVTSGDFIPNAIVSPESTEPNTNYYWHATVTDGDIPQSTHPHPKVPQKENTITWEVHKIVYPPTVTSSYAGGTGAFACPGGTVCTQESSPPGHALQQPGTPNPLRVPTSGKQVETVPDDLASGSRICYVSSVHLPKGLTPYTHTYDDWQYEKIGKDEDGEPIYGWVNHPYDVEETIYKDESTRLWRHSAADCVTVAKRPRVQVRGEDISTRGKIVTSVSKFADGKTFGSWVEYGAFSLDDNEFMASGAGYSEGGTGSNASWSKLTFANNGVEPYGSFGSLPEPPKITEYYASKAGSGWAGLGGASGIFKLVGNQTISGTNVAGSYVIYSTGDVTIDNNITYKNGPFAPSDKLPQVVIIANNIKIKGNVTQIDAWLVTTVNGVEHGSINTCVDVPDTSQLSHSICANQLTVNGPVITGNLLLRRTFGAKPGIDRGVSAEIFRLRPDAYLWGYQQSSSSSIAQTVDISELPPRF